MIKIGDFSITLLGEGKVWIRYHTGEGREFSVKDLEEAIHVFFWEKF